jgi:TRAP-type uncharacterized transport system fused permease subunit
MGADQDAGRRAAVSENMEEISKYDPEVRFRKVSRITLKLTFVMTLVLSIFHIYTAGFGVLQEWRHRSFHLAYVLPLVFFLYAMRKEWAVERKHLIYDLIYAAIGTSVLTAMARELLHLSAAEAALTAAAAYAGIFYFKRREILTHRAFLYADALIFTLMIAALAWGMNFLQRAINFGDVFQDPNKTLIFWSLFLFVTFCCILVLFVVQWLQVVYGILTRRGFEFALNGVPYFDVFFALLSSIVSVYIFLEFNALVFRAGMPSEADLLVGALAFLLVLEGTRRSIGPPLAIIAFIVLINCHLGPYFLDIPGLNFFAHRGYSVERIIEHMYLGTEGIFGIPLGVVATFVFHFVLFGIFISKTGLGQLFIDLAMALAGGTVGGPAKVSVISSGMLGSISGSSIANTVTTGSFTIPLMKKVGYRPQFAGAVEAAASTGGQLMPPIMGAAAFIMAEFLSIPYIKIAACAVIPSFMHFFAVGTMVHFEALKQGLYGLPRESLPRVKEVLRERGLLVLPLVIIVWLLISGTSPFLAAYWGIIVSVAIGQIHRRTAPLLVTILLSVPCVLLWINPFAHSVFAALLWSTLALGGLAVTFRLTDITSWLLGAATLLLLAVMLAAGMASDDAALAANLAVVLVGIFYKESKMPLHEILNTLEWGTKNALAIGAACACVGFIVGATTLTGLGLKFAAAVIELAKTVSVLIMSGDFMGLLVLDEVTLFFTLVFTAVACFILGMGIPTTAQYIIASMIAAPALLHWGVHPLVSHMFVLFYAVLADVTPPVALAAYAASGISGADPFKTGFTAFSLSMAQFYVPFAFVYSPIILWLPHILDPSVPFDYLQFAVVFATVLLGVVALGSTIIGYLRDKSTVLERLGTAVAAGCLLFHEYVTSIAGLVILLGVYFIQRRRNPKGLRRAPLSA